ncbi:MAG: hypothetical protein LBQ94_02525 [Treponema sp.]|jgi:hypothetical protein|nr:hypothetical protein [Treponema sp.]
MKRYILLVFFSLLLSACQKTQTQTQAQSQSESEPIMGYDKVTWGTSIQDVRRTYGISNNVATTPSLFISNMINLEQNNVSDSIESRIFYFLDNKLCQVDVVYRTSAFTVHELLTALKVKFGESTDFEEKYISPTSFEYTTYGKYSPELVICLIRYYDFVLEEESLWVSYWGQKIFDEYEASKVEL